MKLHTLVEAGFPFGADDLDLETWTDLGTFRRILHGKGMV